MQIKIADAWLQVSRVYGKAIYNFLGIHITSKKTLVLVNVASDKNRYITSARKEVQ
jgi:hypothetical protein